MFGAMDEGSHPRSDIEESRSKHHLRNAVIDVTDVVEFNVQMIECSKLRGHVY